MAAGEDPFLGHAQRGVSVQHFSAEFASTVHEAVGPDANVHDTLHPVICRLTEGVQCPRDFSMGAAYVDSIHGAHNANKATFMLSYVWGYQVRDIAQSLIGYCDEKRMDPQRSYVWICCLCVNQHRVLARAERGETVSCEEFQETFGSKVQEIGNLVAMMSPWRAPGYIKRVWCLFEMFMAEHHDVKLEIIMPSQEADSLRASLVNGTGTHDVMETLLRIDIANADSTVIEDKQQILQIINDSVGFERLNTVVSEKLRRWIVTACENFVKELPQKEEGSSSVALCTGVGKFLSEIDHADAQTVLQQGWHLWKPQAVRGAVLLISTGTAKRRAKDFEGALKEFDRAQKVLQNCDMLQTEEYVELLRQRGIALKLTGDYDSAHSSLSKALGTLRKLKKVETEGWADLQRNMGALLFDMGDIDESLDMYMKALKVSQDIGAHERPATASLLMDIGIVKVYYGDIENALCIFQRAKQIRERTGTMHKEGAKFLTRCIADAQKKLAQQKLVSLFKASSAVMVPKEVLATFVRRLPGGEAMVKGWRWKNDPGPIHVEEFIEWLYVESEDDMHVQRFRFRPGHTNKYWAKLRSTTPWCYRKHHSVNHSEKGNSRVLKVMTWNIQSPQFAANPLEFVPDDNVLKKADQDSLQKLLKLARSIMLSPDQSLPCLGDLLGDAPLKWADSSDIERAPIEDERAKKGLRKWLQSREEEWGNLWPEWDIDRVAREWCANYTVRWQFWRQQTVYKWLCDDGSGGKPNPLLLGKSPAIDDVCWDLALSSADKAYSDLPMRRQRARCLQFGNSLPLSRDDPDAFRKPDGVGKHDFFKLLVWDLLINLMLSHIDEEDLNSLLNSLQPPPAEQRTTRVVELVREKDPGVAILLEVPQNLPPGLEERWWVVRAEEAHADKIVNTVILARKDIFREPANHQMFYTKGGRSVNPRIIGCTLTRDVKDATEIHVIGVHLPSGSEESEFEVDALERAIQPNTILGGDFNKDLRRKGAWKGLASRPKLRKLINCSPVGSISREHGSTSKERSPFQAQVTKMFLPDFSMKDFLFAGEHFKEPFVFGMIPRSQRLPDANIPSDHAPIEMHVNIADGRSFEATTLCTLLEVAKEGIRRLSEEFPKSQVVPPSKIRCAQHLVQVLDQTDTLLKNEDLFKKAVEAALYYLGEYERLATRWYSKEKLDAVIYGAGPQVFTETYRNVHEIIKMQEKEEYEEFRRKATQHRCEIKDWPGDLEKSEDEVRCIMSLFFAAGSLLEDFFKPFIESLTVGEKIIDQLKKPFRVLEKFILRDGGVPWDVVRCQIICEKMADITSVMEVIATNKNILLVGMIDRFSKPRNGWADCSIYISTPGLKYQHCVAEVQIVHRKLWIVREQFGAHDVYSDCRFSAELLGKLNRGIVQMAPYNVQAERTRSEADVTIEMDLEPDTPRAWETPKASQKKSLLSVELQFAQDSKTAAAAVDLEMQGKISRNLTWPES